MLDIADDLGNELKLIVELADLCDTEAAPFSAHPPNREKVRPWFRATKRTTNRGLRWVSIWLGFGVLIGLLLLANSVRDYFFVARMLTIQQVRQQIGQHIATFERDLSDSSPSDEQLLKTLSAELNTGSLKPIWIVMRGPDGREIGV